MDKLSDMYYLIRYIISRIFLYLRDVILHEFFWFAEEIDELDTSEPKTRTHPFTRRAIADFVAFFVICALFGSFVVLSADCTKKEENFSPPLRPATPDSEGEPLELVEDDDDCTILSPPHENPRKNAWGDAMVPDVDFFTRQKLEPQNLTRINCSPEIRQSSSSICELRPSHTQSTQTNEKILQRATKNRDWLIRRTRSGHVYGKYPM